MINIKNLYFSYKKDKVLENFNYSFKDNGLYSIIGESGCGKTTLLNLIGGILKPTSGSITFSEDISNLRDSTAFIFQDNNLFDNLTVYENIKLLTSFKTDDIKDEKIDELLETLGVLKYKEKLVSNISGGERQRVSIAIALLMDKKVIIADEPLASLDYTNSKKILTFFKEISKDKLIIFSSHNVDILDEYCDEIIDLEHNKYEIDGIELLSESRNNNKKMRIDKFLYTHHKVMKKKSFIKVISILFMSFCMAILSIIITISQVNYDKILLDELNKNSDSPVIVEPKTLDKYENVKSYLKTKNFSYLEGGSTGNQFGFSRENYKLPSVHVTIDEKLSNYEVKMTDYLFEIYRDAGILPQNLVVGDAVGYVYQTEALNFEGNPFNITIKEIIDAKKNDGENGILNEDWNYENENRFHMNSYTYELLYYFTIYKNDDEDHPNVLHLENGYNQFGGLNYKVCRYYFSEKLDKDEISLSHETLEQIENFYGKKYSINDTIEIKVSNVKKTYTLKEIDDALNNNFILFSTNNIADFNKVPYELLYFEIYDYEPEKIISMMNDLKDTLMVVSECNIDSTTLNIRFNGAHKAYNYYTNLRMIFKMSSVVLSVFCVILALFLTYYALSTYSINKNKFSLLKIYGMRSSNEYYLLEYDLVILLLVSMIIATPLGILDNMFLNSYLKQIGSTSKTFSFFNFGNEILSFLFILAFSSIVFLICYIISSRKKLRTYIGI